MKKILKKYNEPFSAEINQSKTRVIDFVSREKGKKRDFFGFLSSSPVDFDEVTISDGIISIDVMPKMLNPYRGMGKIHMSIQSGSNNSETKIVGEIIPYNSLYVILLCMVMGFLVLWTPIVISMTSGIHTFIMLAFGWTVFPLVLYLMLFWNRSRLREYKEFFLATLMENNKKSIR
ncbi:hypothetical protein [Pontibacter flavimaris]|uniref:Uncharacterized protein n=1 Tax=Pontibacter flavimaris TaxID=1797110 RepID=A0A1Q5PHQ8_9BACT|nr:hypothetical protein [Pontibacter flavimaris]OKL41759.1 hypothetical protein A3841_12105 [Pontibacter flavimaris]